MWSQNKNAFLSISSRFRVNNSKYRLNNLQKFKIAPPSKSAPAQNYVVAFVLFVQKIQPRLCHRQKKNTNNKKSKTKKNIVVYEDLVNCAFYFF